MPPVVAVVYAHNEEAYLPHTLTTLSQFKLKGLINDIVVVDDASTDKTVEIAKRFGAKVLSHNKQKGKRGCFVTGLKQAKRMGAEVMLSLDADIELFPEKTLREMRYKTMHEKFSMAVADQHERVRQVGNTPLQYTQTAEYGRLGESNLYKVQEGDRLENYKQVFLRHSSAQRAIRIDALKPYFNRNSRWVMLLEGDLPKRYLPTWHDEPPKLLGFWGLEASLDYLLLGKKIAYLKSPVFNRPITNTKSPLQATAAGAVDKFRSERSLQAAREKAWRKELREKRK